VIPFGDSVSLFGQTVDLWVSDINVALLYLLAVGAFSIYGIVLGGWSSNNKYSLLGGIRSSAQLISYEVSLGLALVGVAMVASSLSLVQIVKAQDTPFILLQPLGFIVFFIAGLAESNRPPFDLPEADHALPGRMARAAPPPAGLVPDQSRGAHLRVHLAAGHLPTHTLRPAHATRLAHLDPAGSCQHLHYSRRNHHFPVKGGLIAR